MDERELISATANWLAQTDVAGLKLGLSPREEARQMREFLHELNADRLVAADAELNDAEIRVLHAACTTLKESAPGDPTKRLDLIKKLYDFIRDVHWPEPDFGERAELLCECAFAGWRISRRVSDGRSAATEAKWLKRFESTLAQPSPLRHRTDAVLAITRSGRADITSLRLVESELLLSVCLELFHRIEIAPEETRAEAEIFFSYVENSKLRPREWKCFLGELALIAGGACRLLFRRDEANKWFDWSEAHFSQDSSRAMHIARLGYQRLALAVEERRFQEVLDVAPKLCQQFLEMKLVEYALKCGILETAVLHESGKTAEAVPRLLLIYSQAEAINNAQLSGAAATNLAQDYRELGNLREALVFAQKALPFLQRSGSRVNLVKLRWCVGDIFREQGKKAEAVESYREAFALACEVGVRGDQVAIHLALADVLLDTGRDHEAELEIRAALPIIDEEKMVPEGYAALTLLQESLRHRSVDRQALRNLHGFFREPKS